MAGYFEGAVPRVFAHRGFAAPGGSVVENTIPAFRAALELGAHYLETDVHTSLDGVAVVSHDPDLSRLTGSADLVGSKTLAELQQIELGPDATFSSLREVLETFPRARFNIDIKTMDAAAPTVGAIRDVGATDRVLCTSFDNARRLAVVREIPGIATSASNSGVIRALVAGRIGFGAGLRRALAGVNAVQVPATAGPLTVVTRRFVDQLHAVGVEVHVWTVNDAVEMHRLLDLGVDGIVTDRTDIAMGVIGER